MATKKKLPLSVLRPNEDNPRYIRNAEFDELYNSILEFPEMAEAKEIVVNKDYLILGGNMRYHAMQKAGWTEAPVVIVDWSEDKQREFIIKDNVHKGDWDYDKLQEKWSIEEATNWGIDTSRWEIGEKVDTPSSEIELNEESSNPDYVTCPYCGTDNLRYQND